MSNHDLTGYTCSCAGTGEHFCRRCPPAPLPPPPWSNATPVDLPALAAARAPREERAAPAIAPEDAPFPAPRSVEALDMGCDPSPPVALAPPVPVLVPPKRRRGLVMVAAVCAFAAAFCAALVPAAPEPRPERVPAGIIRCKAAAVEKRVPQTKIAYSCADGGKFTCTASVCGVYSVEYRRSDRGWRKIHAGDVANMQAGMDHFFDIDAP